jgi:hypothetical protein
LSWAIEPVRPGYRRMPVHYLLEQILDEYIVAAGLQSGQPLKNGAPLYPPINGSIPQINGSARCPLSVDSPVAQKPFCGGGIFVW